MTKYLIAAFLFLIGGCDFAHAANCSPYPYTLTNGQTADANQVMANFNNVLSCGNSNLLAKSQNLGDVASPATSRINLGLGASAVEGLSNTSAGAVTDDGAGNLVGHVPTLHSILYTSNSTFTVPANATTATVFKYTVSGGGAGGSGSATSFDSGSAGSSAGAGVLYVSGFTPGSSVTISIGGGGSGGAPSIAGSSGSTTTVSYAASNFMTSTGGQTPGNFQGQSGIGVFSANPGGSGLISVQSYDCAPQPGGLGSGIDGSFGPTGGGNCLGSGGAGGSLATGSSIAPTAGKMGGGGGGGAVVSGTTQSGASGGNGFVLIEYTL